MLNLQMSGLGLPNRALEKETASVSPEWKLASDTRDQVRNFQGEPDSITGFFEDRIREHLKRIYPGIHSNDVTVFEQWTEKLIAICNQHLAECGRNIEFSLWDEKDVVLIGYGDHLRHGSQSTLQVLKNFLIARGVDQFINNVHLLPIHPSTSDDGFSVVDYREVSSELGDWSDVQAVSDDFSLMLDLVVNHVSQESSYFQKFKKDIPPYNQFFIVADPALDHSSVTRPRSLPLLTEKTTVRGPVHVWTTFSDDQVDLNYRYPGVLLEIIDVLFHFIRSGGRIIRLDAIAFLWKSQGTTCIHLPQTHEIVKLMRTCIDAVSSRALLLTETNVPHQENISYFGDGDQAHLVYQFSLPPLLLDAYLSQDATVLSDWLDTVCEPDPGTTYFNFTASHDGIGVRPLEGLVPAERIQKLADHARKRGGHVGTRRKPDGTDSPYELNLTYLDFLLTEVESETPGIERFVSSQAMMLALKGIPGIYFNSLFGIGNDPEGVESSGIPRRINRKKFESAELLDMLAGDSISGQIFDRLRKLVGIRRRCSAFHPDALQEVGELPDSRVLLFRRVCQDTGQCVLVLNNFSPEPQTADLKGEMKNGSRRFFSWRDMVSGEESAGASVGMEPYGYRWLLLL